MSSMTLHDFIDPSFFYAVVGATTNPANPSSRVLFALYDQGFSAVGICGVEDEGNGVRTCEALAFTDDRPDVVIVTGCTMIGLKNLIQECVASKLNKIWIQPEVEVDDKILALMGQAGIEVMQGEDFLANI